MALVLRGETPCVVCGRPLMVDDDIEGFPEFLKPNHPLARFSDAAFHKSCFAKAPERAAVMEVYNRYLAIWAKRPVELTSLDEIEAWAHEAFKGFE
jgi:hypothetical protein